MLICKKEVLETIELCRLIGNRRVPADQLVMSDYTKSEGFVNIDHTLKTITTVFAGSKEPKDFIYDAKFHKDTVAFYDDKPVRVHCGFSESEYSVHEEMEFRLSKAIIDNPEYRVCFGGHSLGKSQAELFISRYLGKRWSRLALFFSFGGACTGNIGYVQSATNFTNCLHVRFYNELDTVPKLLDGRFNYLHSGVGFMLKDVPHTKEHPENRVASFFHHDIYLNYHVPITESVTDDFEI